MLPKVIETVPLILVGVIPSTENKDEHERVVHSIATKMLETIDRENVDPRSICKGKEVELDNGLKILIIAARKNPEFRRKRK